MTTYFDKFPRIFYDIDGTGTNVQLVTDILHRAKFLKMILQNSLVFYPYIVKDGETPEIIAAKLYGSSNYYWLVMYANDIFSLWDEWPLSYDQMQAYLTVKYGSVAAAQATIDHWEDSYGNIVMSPDIRAGSYYIDPINGNDSNSGLSETNAWLTTTYADTLQLYNGQVIYYLYEGIWQIYYTPGETVDETALPASLVTRQANMYVVSPYYVNPYNVIPNCGTITSITGYQQAMNINQIKSQIRLVDPYYVPQIDAQLDALLVPVGT
jgi:hypothetical protein